MTCCICIKTQEIGSGILENQCGIWFCVFEILLIVCFLVLKSGGFVVICSCGGMLLVDILAHMGAHALNLLCISLYR